MVIRYLSYLMRSGNRHSVHSPFVFDLVENVLNDKRHFYAYNEIEQQTESMLHSNEVVSVEDLGAGSQVDIRYSKKISKLAKSGSHNRKYHRLLFRLVNHFQPKNMLELGTSLGISAMYQGAAQKDAKFITLEGSMKLADIAKRNLEDMKLNVQVVTGNFDDTLEDVVKDFNQLDYVFFDGNHQKEATLRYFKICLEKISNDGLFIFDDIHWSNPMEEAWEEIKNDPGVTITIDLFFMGLVFFRKEQVKEHFTLRF